jgi:hypothetical protein
MKEEMIKRAHIITAYASLGYFFEIIYIMIALLFLYGKPMALAAGFTLTALLSVQIIGLYRRRNINRKIQLFLMNVHAAYALPYLLGMVIGGFTGTVHDAVFLTARALLAAFELPALYLLTDENIIAGFHGR